MVSIPRWNIVKGKEPRPTRVEKNTLYHGTSSKHLTSIKRHGLVPAGRAGLGATASRSWKLSGGSTADMIGLVGLTDRTRSAAFYASTVTIGGTTHRPIIIEIDKSKINSKILLRRKGSSVGGGKEWDYPKRIPVSAIRGYWVLIKTRGKRKQWVYKKKTR